MVGGAGMGLCQFIALSSRPHCQDPFLSSIWTHPNPWNPSRQRVSPLFFTVSVKCDSWAVLQVVLTSQKGLAFHLKSSLLKLDPLHFLMTPILDENKVLSGFPPSCNSVWKLPFPPGLLTAGTGFCLSCFSPNLDSLKWSFLCTPNLRPDPLLD